MFRRNAQGTSTLLRGTNFEEAFLLNVDATNAIFAANTSFEPANFYKATLENVNFSRANLTGVNLSPIGTKFINLSNANLTNAILHDANLSGE